MPLEPEYLDSIKRIEGYTPRASWDYKQHSVGYGTRAKYPGEVIDKPEAERRFSDEILKARGSVDGIGVPLSPGQRAALTSLTFNAGPGWINSGLGQAVKAGDWNTAAQRFAQYNKAGGEVLPGLANRRTQELSWLTGNPVASSQASAPTASSGAAAPMSSAFKWTPEQNIARTDQWAKQFYDTPIDGRGGALGSILTGALSGLGSGMFSQDASKATSGNQAAMQGAMQGAANAPDNLTLGKFLMGSGIPQLQQSGLNSTVAGREKADDRIYNEGLLKKKSDIELEQARQLAKQKQELEAETLNRQLSIIDRMGRGEATSVPPATAAAPVVAPQLAPITSGDAEAQPGYMQPQAPAPAPAPSAAAAASDTGNPLLDPPRAQSAKYTPEQIQRAKSALALGDKATAAKILSEASDKDGQKAYDTEEGKSLAKDMGGIREAGVKAQSRMTMLGTLKKLAQDPSTPQGPGTTVDLALRKTLAAVGIPTDGLNNAQMFKALSNQLALELRDPSSGAGMPGAMSDSDRAFLIEMSPNLGNTRESNVTLIEYMERIAKRQSDVARLASNYSQNNGGRLDNRFYDLLGKWSAQNNIFTESERKAAPRTAAPAPAVTQKMEFNTDAEIPEGKIVRDTVTGARLVKRAGQLVPYEEPVPAQRMAPRETPIERAARKRAGANDADQKATQEAASIRADFDRDAASLSPIELVRKYDGKRGMLSAQQLNSINEMIGKF